jgi:hypothetical protein
VKRSWRHFTRSYLVGVFVVAHLKFLNGYPITAASSFGSIIFISRAG